MKIYIKRKRSFKITLSLNLPH